jgi:hypothetical protein
MANVKISELPASGAVADGSLIPVVEGGVTKKATREEVIEPAQTAADDAQADATQALADAADALARAAFIWTPLTKGSGNFTLALTDLYQGLVISAAAVITVPKVAVVAIPVGTVIPILRTTSGAVSVAPVDGDVTINKAGSALTPRDQYSLSVLWHYATNTWVLFGDITL